MKLPSITNATLTAVNTAGFKGDYDQAATTGASKWSGAEAVFWSEDTEIVASGDRQKRVGGERSDVLIHRSVVIDAALAVTFSIGDIITATTYVGTETGVVQRILQTRGDGLPSTVRLYLEDA